MSSSNQRGIPGKAAVNMIVSVFCKEVFRELPMEFAVEAREMLGVSLEGSVRSGENAASVVYGSYRSALRKPPSGYAL